MSPVVPRGEPGVLVHLRVAPAAKELVDKLAVEDSITPSELMRRCLSLGVKAYINRKAQGS